MSQIAVWFERHNIGPLTVIATVVVLIAASILILMVNRLLRRWFAYLEARLQLPHETALAIARAVTGGLWLIAAAAILDIWGVGLGGLWTVLVSAVTVIGVGFLATWTMISNFTASFFLMLWRPFQPGQTVEILPENLKGRVIERNLMFTTLREGSGSVLQIPNNFFFQKIFRVSGEAASPSIEARESADVAN